MVERAYYPRRIHSKTANEERNIVILLVSLALSKASKFTLFLPA